MNSIEISELEGIPPQENNVFGNKRKNYKMEWMTPPIIMEYLCRWDNKEFDLDPCYPMECNPIFDKFSKKKYTIIDDGLSKDWEGRVYMNPPYSFMQRKWFEKLSDHGNGIALTFSKTETKLFHQYVFPKASAIYFIEGRVRHYNLDGTIGDQTPTIGSCLISYGRECMEILRSLPRNIWKTSSDKISGQFMILFK